MTFLTWDRLTHPSSPVLGVVGKSPPFSAENFLHRNFPHPFGAELLDEENPDEEKRNLAIELQSRVGHCKQQPRDLDPPQTDSDRSLRCG